MAELEALREAVNKKTREVDEAIGELKILAEEAPSCGTDMGEIRDYPARFPTLTSKRDQLRKQLGALTAQITAYTDRVPTIPSDIDAPPLIKQIRCSPDQPPLYPRITRPSEALSETSSIAPLLPTPIGNSSA